MDSPEAAAPPPTAPTIAFICEMPCIHCAYDLRTILLSDRCPECGKPAADSWDSLAAAGATDIARLRRGLVFAIIAAAAFPALGFLLGVVLSWAQVEPSDGQVAFGAFALSTCGPMLAWLGLWAISRPIPPAAPSHSYMPHQRLDKPLRVLAGVYPCASLLTFLWTFALATLHHSPGESGIVIGAALYSLTAVAWTTRNIFACRRLGLLAASSNSRGCAGFFRVLSIVATVMFTTIFACALLAATVYACYKLWPESVQTIGKSLEDYGMVVGLLYAGALLTFFGWLVAWPIALVIFNRRLRHAYRLSRAHNGRILAPKPNEEEAARIEPVSP